MRFSKQCLQALLTSHFSLPDPARRPPAFSIVPADREPGTGYCLSVDKRKRSKQFLSLFQT